MQHLIVYMLRYFVSINLYYFHFIWFLPQATCLHRNLTKKRKRKRKRKLALISAGAAVFGVVVVCAVAAAISQHGPVDTHTLDSIGQCKLVVAHTDRPIDAIAQADRWRVKKHIGNKLITLRCTWPAAHTLESAPPTGQPTSRQFLFHNEIFTIHNLCVR